MKLFSVLLAGCALVALGGPAHASIVFGHLGTADEYGTGLGSQKTMLTLDTHGNWGAVGRWGPNDVTFGPVHDSQSQTYAVSDLFEADDRGFNIVWNANGKDATLNKMNLFFTDGYGMPLATVPWYSTTWEGSVNSINNGLGKSDQVFQVQFDQALWDAFLSSPDNRVGMWAGLSEPDGKNTFYISQAQVQSAAVPEPSTYALLITAMSIVTIMRYGCRMRLT